MASGLQVRPFEEEEEGRSGMCVNRKPVRVSAFRSTTRCVRADHSFSGLRLFQQYGWMDGGRDPPQLSEIDSLSLTESFLVSR